MKNISHSKEILEKLRWIRISILLYVMADLFFILLAAALSPYSFDFSIVNVLITCLGWLVASILPRVVILLCYLLTGLFLHKVWNHEKWLLYFLVIISSHYVLMRYVFDYLFFAPHYLGVIQTTSRGTFVYHELCFVNLSSPIQILHIAIFVSIVSVSIIFILKKKKELRKFFLFLLE